jgi:hypothetical protein
MIRVGAFIRAESVKGEVEDELFSDFHGEEDMGSFTPNFIDPGRGMQWDATHFIFDIPPAGTGHELNDLMSNKKVLYITGKFHYQDSMGPLKCNPADTTQLRAFLSCSYLLGSRSPGRTSLRGLSGDTS